MSFRDVTGFQIFRNVCVRNFLEKFVYYTNIFVGASPEIAIALVIAHKTVGKSRRIRVPP